MKGNGKAFSAGGDVVDNSNRINDPSEDPHFIERYFSLGYNNIQIVKDLSQTKVAIWDGFTMGAGVGQSMFADFRIATENTVYSMPETKIGYFTDQGSTYFHSRLSSGQGMGAWLGLTAQFVKAQDAVSLGLATHYIHSSKLEKVEREIEDNPDEIE